jgi:bacterioferritin-associated ferredoxin
MYLCICCDITNKDIEENPELEELIGSVCGRCLEDSSSEEEVMVV